MTRQRTFQVAGVDGCKGGWFVATASVTKESSQTDTPCVFALKDVLVASTFTRVLSKTAGCKLVCVDIPIGLSDGNKPRECDLAARKILRGPRASSVFPAPIRPCLSAQGYEMAKRICLEHTGKKLSKQSFALLRKIRQVDDLMTPELQRRVREIHPELAFWALAGGKSAKYSKKSVAGRNERIALLSPIFSDLEQFVSRARQPEKVAPDDILDALAAAWTAGQAVVGNARTLPENPEFDSTGLRTEILYPAAYDPKSGVLKPPHLSC